MANLICTLPINLLELLDEKAKALGLPKNKIIENALRIYLNQLNKAEYVRSYKKMAVDTDIISAAEEGIEDYLSLLD